MISPLPVHPQPLPDELFSSWVYRVARANGQNVFSFCHLLLPELKRRYYDIDNAVNTGVLQNLSQLLRTPYVKAWETTLDSYGGLLYSISTPKANRKTCILHTGITKNLDKRFSLQYCPLCLAEHEPYYRKVWRISFITVCTKHACKLHDRCPQCHKPVKPLLNDIGQPHKMPFLGNITQCSYCSFELHATPVQGASRDLVVDTHFYEKVLKAGYSQLGTTSDWIYSFSFFCVLRHLLYLLRPESHQKSSPDVMSHESRYVAMKKLAGVFNDWPSRLIELCHQSDIKYYHFTNMTKSRAPIPYWFDIAIRSKLYEPNLGPTKESVSTVLHYMKSNNLRISLLQVNKLLGYRDSGLAKQFYKEIIKQYQP